LPDYSEKAMMQKKDLHVLIVDDDLTFSKAISEAISRQGYSVTHVAKPDEALAFVKLHPIHLAIIDCMLPKMNGPELARRLRADISRDLPIFLMSGIFKDKTFSKEAIQSTHALAFLYKPFELDDLIKLVNNQLSLFLDSPHLPIYEAMFKENLSHKERIRAVNDSEHVHGYDLPWVYSLLMHPRVSGNLNIISADGEISGIGFDKGRIIQVSQRDKKSYFGVLMVEHGFITQTEIDEAVKNSPRTGKVGELLVNANLLSPHAIEIVMAEQQLIRLSRTIAETSVNLNFVEAEDIHVDANFSRDDLCALINDWLLSKLGFDWLKSFYLPWMPYNLKIDFDPIAPATQTWSLPVVKKVPGLSPALFSKSLTLEQLINELNQSEEVILPAIHALILNRVMRFDQMQRTNADAEINRNRLTKLIGDLSNQNYFERLGVSPKAQDQEINRAFTEFGKILHPDVLSKEAPDDLRELTRTAYRLVAEAYSTLADSDSKQSYLLELDRTRSNAALNAEQFCENARTCLSKGEIGQARTFIEQALKLSTATSEMNLLHMWVRLKDIETTKNQQLLEEIRDNLSRIPAEDRHNATYYFIKGLLQSATNDIAGAKRSLEHAITFDPNFIDARRELNILTLRKNELNKPVDILRGDLKDVVGLLFKKRK
jgi:CheY-like chemotaxis protein